MRLLDRRTVLTGATAAATSALAPSLSIVPATAAAPPAGKQAPSFYRHKVGDFEITVLSDGIFQTKMERSPARNASLEEVQAALSASFMPADQTVFHFNQNVVNTGSKLVLIDTGNFPGRPGTGLTLSNLTASGIDPKAVDVVIISHFHQDHIGGLRTANGDLIYPNAEIMVPAVEWAHWMDDAKMNAAPRMRVADSRMCAKSSDPSPISSRSTNGARSSSRVSRRWGRRGIRRVTRRSSLLPDPPRR